jgi:rRNA-processing protein FCF1
MASDRARGDKIRKTVILDSSAILSFFEFSVDWEKEFSRLLDGYTIIVPSQVMRELEILSKHTSSKRTQRAAASLKFVERYGTVDSQAVNADDAIIEVARKTKGIVATNDSDLRRRLKHESIPVLFLRGKKKLALEE